VVFFQGSSFSSSLRLFSFFFCENTLGGPAWMLSPPLGEGGVLCERRIALFFIIIGQMQSVLSRKREDVRFPLITCLIFRPLFFSPPTRYCSPHSFSVPIHFWANLFSIKQTLKSPPLELFLSVALLIPPPFYIERCSLDSFSRRFLT